MIWYLSFCDLERPGDQWVGGCFVEADSFIEAVQEAHAQGCNPGGEVHGGPKPEHVQAPQPRDMNRLITTVAELENASDSRCSTVREIEARMAEDITD